MLGRFLTHGRCTGLYKSWARSTLSFRTTVTKTEINVMLIEELKSRESMEDFAKKIQVDECRELALVLLREAHKRDSSTDISESGDTTFDSLDLNRDGMLTRREFNTWYEVNYSSLMRASEGDDSDDEANAKPIIRRDLALICLRSMIPYIGFGVCDNALMIICGDLIDQTLGVKFALSTMAAAGLGNMVSCSTGVFTGGVIDRWVANLGLPSPKLTNAQREGPQVRNATLLGSLLGITSGCLIGMFPLFFMEGGFFRKEVVDVEKSDE
eukprot:GDKJ01037291.1.p1 GENE.GDKJ01037291.1~~GDKJ01037291.1.p1  ORF type:complete len:269 (+),score=46.49 GDKJ01037291.1:26-832(+)